MKIIGIVDPYSSGALLSQIFAQENIQCISIRSSKIIPELYKASYKKQDFLQEIVFDNNLEEIINTINALNFYAILPGTESGVTLAEELAHYCGLNANIFEMKDARRNKFLMQECIRQAGLQAIKHSCVKSEDDIKTWLNEHNTYPVIIKPIDSAGSDQVYKCNTPAEVMSAASKIINHKNALNIINDNALLQEHLSGIEYVVDTVSCNGKHFTTNGGRYTKVTANGSDVVYRQLDFLHPNETILANLITYNDKVLDALGIIYGPAHSEIIITSTGPTLVEVGARLHGGNTPATINNISNLSQLNLCAAAYTDSLKFIDLISKGAIFSKHATVFFFINSIEKVVKKIAILEELPKLESYFNAVWNIKANDCAQKTVNLFTSPGWVVLLHEDKNVIAGDILKLIEFEKNNRLFDWEE